MMNTILWTLAGNFSGYVTSHLIDHYHYKLYNRNISNVLKYNIIICITFFGFLRGYTSNDLVTNISKIIMNCSTE